MLAMRAQVTCKEHTRESRAMGSWAGHSSSLMPVSTCTIQMMLSNAMTHHRCPSRTEGSPSRQPPGWWLSTDQRGRDGPPQPSPPGPSRCPRGSSAQWRTRHPRAWVWRTQPHKRTRRRTRHCSRWWTAPGHCRTAPRGIGRCRRWTCGHWRRRSKPQRRGCRRTCPRCCTARGSTRPG